MERNVLVRGICGPVTFDQQFVVREDSAGAAVVQALRLAADVAEKNLATVPEHEAVQTMGQD